MLNIKSVFFGLHWWLSSGCLPMGTEPLHQRVWWEEKAEDGVERKGWERGRMTGSRKGSGELVAAPTRWHQPLSVGCCSHPKPPEGQQPTVGSCQEGQGSRRSSKLVPALFTSRPTFHLFTYQNLTLQ